MLHPCYHFCSLKLIFCAMGFCLPLMSHALVVSSTDTPSPAANLSSFGQEATNSINQQAVSSGQLANKPVAARPQTTKTNVSAEADNKTGNQVVAGKKANDTNQAKTKEPPQPVPQTQEDIAQIMIGTVNEVYKDRCACPYDGDKDGFECGLESLYYRPAGYRVTCYPQDIRGQQYIFYRKNAN